MKGNVDAVLRNIGRCQDVMVSCHCCDDVKQCVQPLCCVLPKAEVRMLHARGSEKLFEYRHKTLTRK